jgi:hypothetical protein
MLANFHFDHRQFEDFTTNVTENKSEISRNLIGLGNLRMINPLEIVVFIWILSHFIEELKQVAILRTFYTSTIEYI